MFLCRSGRLPAAALARTFRCPGSFLPRIDATGPGSGIRTARTGLLLHLRGLRRASVGPRPAHPREREPDLVPVRDRDRDASPWCFVDSARRFTAGGGFDNIWRRKHSGRDTEGVVVSTGGCGGVATRRCSTFSSTIMQLGASSSGAAAKKEQPEDADKVDIQEASTTSTPDKSLEDTPDPGEGKPNRTQQLKKVFKEYGAVGVSFHIGISLMSLGMFYLLISSGIDMTGMLCKLGFSEAVVQSKMAAGTSTFVLAYAIHKLFAPVRISITLMSVPLIVRYFRKTGLFKPPTPAP